MYLILGYGVSNKAVVNKFKEKNIKYLIVVDKKELENIKEDNVIEFEYLKYIDLKRVKYAIKSPGILKNNYYIRYLKSKYVKVINEIELTYILTKKKGYYIGVSGSCGKSSSVSLLYELLKVRNNNVIIAGNIGIPLITYLDEINDNTIIILELSNFQLEDFNNIHLNIALLLNIYDNHLDCYKFKKEYYLTKFRLVNNQNKNDFFIYNGENKIIKKYIKEVDAKSVMIDYNLGYKCENNKLIYYDKTLLNLSSYLLKGEHNISNLKGILRVINILDYEIDSSVINKFHPLKYHLQENYNNDILIINDSKSTSLASLLAALETYKTYNIILLFGGYNKNLDFLDLNKYNLKYKICFGDLGVNLDSRVSVDEKIYWLKDATYKALTVANKNDIILFSPGCASFDCYMNYFQRGKAFDEYVMEYYEDKKI